MSLAVAPVATLPELRLETLRSGYRPVVGDVRHTTRAVEVGRRDTGQAKQATLGVRVLAAVTGACEAHLRHGERSRCGGVLAAIGGLHGGLRTPFPRTVQHELRAFSAPGEASTRLAKNSHSNSTRSESSVAATNRAPKFVSGRADRSGPSPPRRVQCFIPLLAGLRPPIGPIALPSDLTT